MIPILRNTYNISHANVIFRSFCGSAVLGTKQYRLERGLSVLKNAEGILTDGPDYTFLDGRPTPLLCKQKDRMLKQQQYASQIVDLCSEIDFAKERHQNIQKEKEDERQRYISNKLKSKGQALKKH